MDEPPSVLQVPDGSRPFWSVMIPSYNSADLLGATLESVLQQDPGEDVMQIEVVDDGSERDDLSDVVRRVGQGRVGYYRQPHNVGAPANFTTCVRRSVGHWVHILHSDDLVLPGFYDRYRLRIESCPDIVMVGARTSDVDADGRHVNLTVPVKTEGGYLLDAARTIATSHPLRCVSVVVARFAYEEVGAFYPGLFHANDWEMWTRVASRGPVGWVDEPLGVYRMHEHSDTSRLHRSTAYIDDCLLAADLIATHFELADRNQVRRAARRKVSEYALNVSEEMLEQGELRLAAVNAFRAVRIDHDLAVRDRATATIRQAVTKRIGR
jgi:glycosyltransferase involved in cell wall biosynthesis